MAKARRRDEWDRWSRLLALVDARTQFGDKPQPVRPIDLWPKDLVTTAHQVALERAEASQRMEISMRDFVAMTLAATPRMPGGGA